jgi:hypothetical protein
MTEKIEVRLLIAAAVALVAIANWPAIILINRVWPFVLGLPLFVFAALLLNILVSLLLVIAYRVTDE